MTNPAGLLYSKVVGNYQTFTADGGDADDLPDFVALEGTGTITPNVLEARNINAGLESIYLSRPIDITVVAGKLTSGTNEYVMLLRPSPGITPTAFNYTISLKLRAVGSSDPYVSYGPYSFDVGSDTVDLALAVPVASSAGTPVIIGPAGPPGPPGDGTATLSIGTVTSGATADASITGTVLSLVLPKGDPGINGTNGVDGVTQDVSGKVDKDATQATDTSSWIRRLTLGYTPATTSSDFFQMIIGGVKKMWQNEWGAIRGTSPYSWGDALVRAVRSDSDGITSGNFVELQDRRAGANSNNIYARRWTDGALVRNGVVMADALVLGPSDAVPAGTPAGTIIVRKTA